RICCSGFRSEQPLFSYERKKPNGIGQPGRNGDPDSKKGRPMSMRKRNRKTEESRALNVRAAAALVVCGLALLIAEGSLDANTFDNNAPTGCEGEVGGTYTPPVETED